MINYTATGLVGLLKAMHQESGVAETKLQMIVVLRQHPELQEQIPVETYMVTPGDMERLEGMLGYASHLCQQLGLNSARNRVERFQIRLRGPALNPAEVQTELACFTNVSKTICDSNISTVIQTKR